MSCASLYRRPTEGPKSKKGGKFQILIYSIKEVGVGGSNLRNLSHLMLALEKCITMVNSQESKNILLKVLMNVL